MYKIILPILAIALSACNSTSKSVDLDKCNQTNWNEVGYETAMSGKSVRYFNKFEEQCGIKLAKNAKSQYIEGFTLGIKEYCTYDNGFEIASKSLPNKKTCPFELRADFDKGYKVAAAALKEQKEILQKRQQQLDANRLSVASDK